jgi:hypothetical protein
VGILVRTVAVREWITRSASLYLYEIVYLFCDVSEIQKRTLTTKKSYDGLNLYSVVLTGKSAITIIVFRSNEVFLRRPLLLLPSAFLTTTSLVPLDQNNHHEVRCCLSPCRLCRCLVLVEHEGW